MKSFDQGAKARDLVIPTLTEGLDIPVPQQIIDDEVKRHLEAEGREDDAVHGAEVAESAEKAFRTQFVLDQIVEAEQVKVSQGELTTHLVRGAAQYGMTPNDYAKALDEAGRSRRSSPRSPATRRSRSSSTRRRSSTRRARRSTSRSS